MSLIVLNIVHNKDYYVHMFSFIVLCPTLKPNMLFAIYSTLLHQILHLKFLTYRQSYLTLCTIKIIRAYVQLHIFVPNTEAEHVSCHVFNIITSNFASEVLTYRQSHLTLCTIKITTCFCSASYFRAQH